jgi:hypothetical protein
MNHETKDFGTGLITMLVVWGALILLGYAGHTRSGKG